MRKKYNKRRKRKRRKKSEEKCRNRGKEGRRGQGRDGRYLVSFISLQLIFGNGTFFEWGRGD